MRTYKPGLAVMFLLMCSGCSKATPPPIVQQVKVQPPAALLLPIEEPRMQGTTNKHLAAWAIDLQAALRKANENLKALREWSDERDQ